MQQHEIYTIAFSASAYMVTACVLLFYTIDACCYLNAAELSNIGSPLTFLSWCLAVASSGFHSPLMIVEND